MLAGRDSANRCGYDYPFASTASILRSSDISIGNLEAPITLAGTEYRYKKFRFRTKPQLAAAIKRTGFSILTLANNHMLDFGENGLLDTLKYLDGQSLLYCGAGKDLTAARTEALLIANGKTVAFLAYSLTLPQEFYATEHRAGTAPGFETYYSEDIRRVRRKADYVVVSFHWGTEKAVLPNPYQIKTAHRAVDAGADLVLGHHPHVLQGIEHYKNGIIFYSLGNFAFASSSPNSDRSVIVRISLDGANREVEIIPLNVLNREVRFQPQVLTGKRGNEVIARLNAISKGFGTVISENDGRYLVGQLKNWERLAQK